MAIPPPILIPQDDDPCAAPSLHCHEVLRKKHLRDDYVTEWREADWADAPTMGPSHPISWSFPKGAILRHYESDASATHVTAVFQSHGRIFDVTHVRFFDTVEQWIATLTSTGSFYINCRNAVDQALQEEKKLQKKRVKTVVCK